MTDLIIDARGGIGSFGGESFACTLGRTGTVRAEDKREGDGATPLGRWPISAILLRPDRVSPLALHLPWRWLRPDDGWSDDPADPVYNRPVRHPHKFRAERLWRNDPLYDAIVILAHNAAPPLRGHGSAIFLHVAPTSGATEGCVAIARERLIALLPRLRPVDAVSIV